MPARLFLSFFESMSKSGLLDDRAGCNYAILQWLYECMIVLNSHPGG